MNADLEFFMTYWPFLVPLILLQLGLGIFSAVHVVKHPNYRFGNTGMWLVIVLFLQFVGPLIYFTVGRGER